MIIWIEGNGIKWATDKDGNRCSVTYFGSEEAAEKALKSLENCKNCINCSDCSSCRSCSDCSDCSDCSSCSDCSDCSSCSSCSDCSYCRDCSSCSDCSYCRDCSSCSDCSSCRSCSDCSDCSDCSSCRSCSDCSDCSDCSSCSDCSFKEKQTGDFKLPEIPKIENIHQQVYVNASQPNALDMSAWHTCNTTHCRAGWINHMAGEAGKQLEAFYGEPLAALKIYQANSDIKVHMTDFFKTNEEAMADMKRLADEEAALSAKGVG